MCGGVLKQVPTVHLVCGFLGGGKTTLAKELEAKLKAKRFTHDEFMVEKYGRNPDDFARKFAEVDEYIRKCAAEAVTQGRDVIMDYGFWNHEVRQEYYEWAKNLPANGVFHLLECDFEEAKRRVLRRSKDDKNALVIDEATFDILLAKYEPWGEADNFPVVVHCGDAKDYIGKIVRVKMDRPKGSLHPKFGYEYPLNYGFVEHTISGDGEELDAYVLGEDEPLEEFVGKCIAVVRRVNDNDDKLVVVAENRDFSNEEIEQRIEFQEKWFKHILLR